MLNFENKYYTQKGFQKQLIISLDNTINRLISPYISKQSRIMIYQSLSGQLKYILNKINSSSQRIINNQWQLRAKNTKMAVNNCQYKQQICIQRYLYLKYERAYLLIKVIRLILLQYQIEKTKAYQMQVLQLYVNSCVKDSGEMFDFNTQPFEQSQGFKANLIHLTLPKQHSHIYYFIHKSTLKYQNNFIKIQRSKQFVSTLNPKNYVLMGGVKLFYQKNQNGKLQLMMNCFAGKEIYTPLGNFQIKQEGLPFMVAKTFKNGIPLKSNQIIKMGKIQYRVTQVQEQPNKQQYLQSLSKKQIMNLDKESNLSTDQDSQQQKVKTRKQNGDDFCRICHMNDEQQGNILIHPCNCNQSIGSVHIDCFKQWMNVKMSKMRGEDYGAFHTNQLFCEICKQTLPKAIKINGEIIPVLNLFDDFKPYVGLVQNCTPTIKGEEATQGGVIYVTMNQQNKVDIGRLTDNGVILTEITVSRRHAQIVLNQNKFYLKDSDSKFGTLVYDKQCKIRLSKNMKAFQVKNTVFSLKIVKK